MLWGEKNLPQIWVLYEKFSALGVSVTGVEFPLGASWAMLFLWPGVKKLQGNRDQSLSPEIKVHCAAKKASLYNFLLLNPFKNKTVSESYFKQNSFFLCSLLVFVFLFFFCGIVSKHYSYSQTSLTLSCVTCIFLPRNSMM